MSEEIKKQESLLKDALTDIDKELIRLKQRKEEMESQISEAKKGITLTQNEEQKLRDDISQLVAKEAGLNNKRTEINKKLDKLKEKMDKIRKIKEEIEDID